ncbi:glycosyltransferase [Luminiphilus sp.]|nr:glycosyltransferase [Luminiphilus sp.]
MKAVFFLDKPFPSNHSFVDDFLERYFSSHELLLVYEKPRGGGASNKGLDSYDPCEVTLPRRGLRRFLNIYVVFKFLLNNQSYQVVLVRNCPAMLLGAKLYSRCRRSRPVKLIYMSSYDHEGRASGLKRRLALFMHSLFPKTVTGLLAVSDGGLERVRRLYPEAAHLLTIPLCSSSEGPVTDEHASPRGPCTSFIYGGSFDPDREFDVVLKAFSKLLIQGRCKLTLVGVDPDQAGRWRDQYSWMRNKNITILNKLPRPKYLESVANVNFGLSIVPESKINKEMSPTKLLEYFNFGVPAIASDNVTFQRTVVEQYGSGILTKFDEEKIGEAIECAILMGESEYINLCNGARSAATAFSYIQYVDKFRVFCQPLS